MAEGGKSGPVLAHARLAQSSPAAAAAPAERRKGGRLNRKKIFPSFLLPGLPSLLPFLFFLSIGLAVARAVAVAAASGSVM